LAYIRADAGRAGVASLGSHADANHLQTPATSRRPGHVDALRRLRSLLEPIAPRRHAARVRLGPFIQENMERILVDWEAFAKTLYPPGAKMTPLALRDHAQKILQAVVTDLATPQTHHEQAEKSMGRAPVVHNAPETAAQTHAILRAQSGLDINQLAAEYRALRASVLRLWQEKAHTGPEEFEDVIRFNEGIDQALAESVKFFSMQVDQSRNLLLGMLGHDMRNPLNAIVMTASNLASLSAGEDISEAAMVLIRSGASIKALLDDLVDFNRTKLGLGLNIARKEIDLTKLFTDEINQHRVVHPETHLELTLEGNVTGQWDGERLQQVLRNLVSNALAYGATGEPVRVMVEGDDDTVRIAVANRGPVIDPTTADYLFDPLQRGAAAHRRSGRDGLGLGLYIVREITRAHGGTVDLRSSAEETVISVCLPRDSHSAGDAPSGELASV
jgi:signal transduction histidine kinase